MCGGGKLTYSYTAEPVCVADFPHVRFTATGTGDVYIAQNTHSAGLARAGGPPITLPWDEYQAIPFPTTDWEALPYRHLCGLRHRQLHVGRGQSMRNGHCFLVPRLA